MNIKLKTILETTWRYPIILLSAFISALSLIIFLEDESKNFIFAKISATSSLGISLFFAIQMYLERKAENISFYKKLGYYLLGTIILALHYSIILPIDIRSPKLNEVIVNITVYICSHLIVSFIPFIFTKDKEYQFWEYNKNLFVNICFSYLFIGIFVIGINLALLAISKLFGINISTKIHNYFSLFSTIFGSCFIFLSFSPSAHRLVEKYSEYPIVLKFFIQFILIPLLIIYGVILYIYGIKILFTWELPKGWVSFMIMAYSSVGVFAYLLVYPLGKSNSKSWVRFFFTIFHYSILPLLVLLFIAIFTRVLEYGITENRYFVLLYAIWLTVFSIYFVFSKKNNIQFIPISLFLFAVFSISAPLLNVFYISKMSQKNELKEILKENDLLKNGKIDFNQPISNKNALLIADKIIYLSKRGEKDFIMDFIEENKQNVFNQLLGSKIYFEDITKHFDIKDPSDYINTSFFSIDISSDIIKLDQKYDYYISLDRNPIRIDHKNSIYYDSKSKTISLKSDGEAGYSYDLNKRLIEYILQNEKSQTHPPIYFSLGKYDCLLITNIDYTKKRNEISNIYLTNNLNILLKKR